MQKHKITVDDSMYVLKKLMEEEKFLTQEQKKLFQKYALESHTIVDRCQKTEEDDCVFVVWKNSKSVIFFDDIEEYFGVGELRGNCVYWDGVFTSLSECIYFLG